MQEIEEVELPRFETMPAVIPGSNGKLTDMQRQTFWVLYAARGRIVPHHVMWDTIYGERPDSKCPKYATVKTRICHMRPKLPGWEIENHHGIGYSMKPAQPSDPNASTQGQGTS